MANVRVRAASMYVKGKRAGEFSGTKYSRKSGDEAQFGDPGYLGHSDGAETTEVSADGIHPVGGITVPSLQKAMSNKEDLDIVLSLIDGSIHQITMRCTQADTTSDHKNGTQMGSYTLQGGAPKII